MISESTAMRRILVSCSLAFVMHLMASAAAPVRIMPLGDSITEMGYPSTDKNRSYRYYLYHQLVALKYPIDFVGESTTKRVQGPDFDRDASVHWGTACYEVNPLIPGILKGLSAKGATPDIVLVHLGTNDTWRGKSAAQITGYYRDLVRLLRDGNPSVTILFCKIYPNKDKESVVRTLAQDYFDSFVREMTTSKSPVLGVDMYTWFIAKGKSMYETYTIDGVHPNAACDQAMAARFLDALTHLLEGTPTSAWANRKHSPMPRALSPCPSSRRFNLLGRQANQFSMVDHADGKLPTQLYLR